MPLRSFLEAVLEADWPTLTDQGVFLLHAVKCAIVPIEGGFQNPPAAVVDRCAPVHLRAELGELMPEVVVTLGDRAYRAFSRAVSTEYAQLALSKPPKAAMPGQQGFLIRLQGRTMLLPTSRFPRGAGRIEATAVVRRAAAVARITAS